MKISFSGMAASVGCMILCFIFLYWNPYSGDEPNSGTVRIMFMMLILPACIGLVNSFFRNRTLMYIVFAWSLPYGLYVAVASIPSIWNLYVGVLVLYLVSSIWENKREAIK
ncbi:hypothetical protein D7Z26_14570 [Cohnella endophytica]|uniref:Uncharacterized protein n=1 Tax=Cohnella endophytica TaxID=2419778 RepID=A0A494XVJ3_9BACL|nr:hypothetical protein [Cohnella endophytica]RKP52966.1 hypothetical protein D7Z26_14570 [Cohnella endophytica]